MIIPLFLVLVLSVFEFAFMFNALLSIGHATRDAALIAAEAGNAGSADCVILRAIEDDVTAPTSKNRITEVLIYRSDANGTVKNSNTYMRGGSTSCTMADGSTLTVPYTATATGYPATSRCNIVGGCPVGAPTQTAGHDRRPDHLLTQLGDAARQLHRRRRRRRPRSSSPTRCAWSRSCDRLRPTPAPGGRPPGAAAHAGQGLVEFAVLVPMFMLLLMGMLEFGLAFSHHQTLQYATREGARAGAALSNGGGKLGCAFGQSPNAADRRPADHRRRRARPDLGRVAGQEQPVAHPDDPDLPGQPGRQPERRQRQRLDATARAPVRASTARSSTTSLTSVGWGAVQSQRQPARDGRSRWGAAHLHVPDADRPRRDPRHVRPAAVAGPARDAGQDDHEHQPHQPERRDHDEDPDVTRSRRSSGPA